jgi:hypothetical protein
MPRGQIRHTPKQKRKAEHIEASYEERGWIRAKPKPVPGRPSKAKRRR